MSAIVRALAWSANMALASARRGRVQLIMGRILGVTPMSRKEKVKAQSVVG